MDWVEIRILFNSSIKIGGFEIPLETCNQKNNIAVDAPLVPKNAYPLPKD